MNIAIQEMILPRIVRSLLQPEAKPSDATAEELHTVSTFGRSAGKTDIDETETVKLV